jgi:alkylation response protein AidB-like acyl-CoA dehydrogenase
VDFAPTASQQLLVTIARDFLDKHCPPARAQEMAADARGVSDELWQAMASLGWPGLLVPPALGGSGGSVLDVVLLAEEMGRACLPGPYVPSAVVATSALLDGGPAAERLLARMALGERIATLAVAEESASFAPDAIAMRAGVPGRLDGDKLFVKDAHVADVLIVAVRGDRGVTLLLIERDRPGITLTPLDTMSGDRLFAVSFREVEVRESDVIGTAGGADGALATALRAGALARAAEMVGAAGRVLDLVVEHAKVRVQSGRPIGAFQAIQHTCADLLRNVEGSRWIVRTAAWEEATGPAAAADVAMAKAWAGEACLAVARRAHQVFGAIGFSEEHPLHLYHKRIHAASLDCGDVAAHLETVARAIGLD